jgi:glucokinase
MLYVTVSTGVGGGLVVNGRVVRGADGMVGEIGHMQLDPAGPRCSCGHRGCVEAMASGISIARNARELLSEDASRSSLLRGMTGGDLEALTAEMVSAAAAAGDVLATRVLAEAATALGRGIGNALSLLNPDVVVLGGGVTKAGDMYWETLRRVAGEIVLPGVAVRLVPAALGDEAPLWGATALAAMVSEGTIR